MSIRSILALVVGVMTSAPLAADTCDINHDGECSVADLLLLQQSLTSPPACRNMTLGTGNDLSEPTPATFAQEWIVIATDSGGNAIANGPIHVGVRSLLYKKGFLAVNTVLGQWTYDPQNNPPVQCPDEDSNHNGILDPGEDNNSSGRIEAGNVAILAPVAPSAPTQNACASAVSGGTEIDVMTNDLGIGRFCVIWPQNFSWWVDLRLEAGSADACGASANAQTTTLRAQPDDTNNIQTTPPHVTSPFGTQQDCTVPPPGLPLL